MNSTDLESPAYLKGVADGQKYNAEPTVAMLDSIPNPYDYGSHDWKMWNLGWNNTVMK
jgi:hypothetical protein